MAETSIGGISGHLAVPTGGGPFPTLLVVQEWWGLDQQTRAIADRFASQGYLAFAPDLYHGELAELGDNEAAMRLTHRYAPKAPAAMAAAFDGLRARTDVSRIGSIGFCFGGRMSLALGLQRSLDAVATFYGGQMNLLFDQMDDWKTPTIGFFGDADPSIPVEAIDGFRAILDRSGVDHAVTVYPNSGHAFFRDDDPSVYRPEAALDAWRQTLDFFAKHLTAP